MKKTQGGEILPYGSNALAFREGNETVEDQVEYYAYMNKYIRENNIPGVQFKSDDDVLPILDKLGELMTTLIQQRTYMESGTDVIGDIAESETTEIRLDKPEREIKRRNRNRLV